MTFILLSISDFLNPGMCAERSNQTQAHQKALINKLRLYVKYFLFFLNILGCKEQALYILYIYYLSHILSSNLWTSLLCLTEDNDC